MKSLNFEIVKEKISPEQFSFLTSRCAGMVIPGRRTELAKKREEFFNESFDGDYDGTAMRFGVSTRTIRRWQEEQFTKKYHDNNLTKENQR